jgi:iron complex outermembrane recepter protein
LWSIVANPMATCSQSKFIGRIEIMKFFFVSPRTTVRREATGLSAEILGSKVLVASLAALSVCALIPQVAEAQTSLEEVTVTANPLRSNELVVPTRQYSGTGLVLRSQSSLGETLSGTPGVSSTYFGPQASRPIIRGLDGDRIKILNNSGASLDASSLSYDHAVAIDPLIADRIEILRGPGTLIYGGNAIGGVVNVIDNRIPRTPMEGLQGRGDISVGSGDRSRNGVLVLEAGNKDFAFHADVHSRTAGDVSVPRSLPCLKAGSLASDRRLCNSAAKTEGGAVGATAFFERAYLGLSLSEYSSNYGSVAEDTVSIAMRSNRLALEGEIQLNSWLKSIKGQYSYTDYKHTELDSGVPATVFTNRGFDFRLEARHQKWAGFDGVMGLHLDANRFGAQGLEAFAPSSQTKTAALFVYEEALFPWGKINFGGRIESQDIQAFSDPTIARFLAAERSFKPASVALGALYKLDPNWSLTSNLTLNQRAPKDYELFANGPHLATAAYEVGNAQLSKERSTNLELGVAWRGAATASGRRSPNFMSANAFLSQFQNYLMLESTGKQRTSAGAVNPTDLNGDGLDDASGAAILPEFAYTQHRARLTGLEVNGNWRLREASSASQTFDLQWRADFVKGTNTDNNTSLPRISPLRMGATLVWAQNGGTQLGWGARVGIDRYARPADQSTEAYSFLNLALTYRMKTKIAGQDSNLLFYARADNATDRLAYSATSILTQSLPGRVPLPGRSLKLGVQAMF